MSDWLLASGEQTVGYHTHMSPHDVQNAIDRPWHTTGIFLHHADHSAMRHGAAVSQQQSLPRVDQARAHESGVRWSTRTKLRAPFRGAVRVGAQDHHVAESCVVALGAKNNFSVMLNSFSGSLMTASFIITQAGLDLTVVCLCMHIGNYVFQRGCVHVAAASSELAQQVTNRDRSSSACVRRTRWGTDVSGSACTFVCALTDTPARRRCKDSIA